MMYKNNFVVVVKCNGSILREKDGGKVYLPFGSEYSILLKNKDARRALVEIEVDGKNVLGGRKLIMSGNETQEIKGFMRDMSKTNKFKFIKKTREIQKHRGDRIDDGLVRVTYQFEEPPKPIVANFYYRSPSIGGYWSDRTYYGTDLIGSSYCSTGETKFSNNATPNVDEGITVKGGEVNQSYTQGHIGSLSSEIGTIVLHLLGLNTFSVEVSKPLTVTSKLFCETCGRKTKSNNKFCPNCGTYLR